MRLPAIYEINLQDDRPGFDDEPPPTKDNGSCLLITATVPNRRAGATHVAMNTETGYVLNKVRLDLKSHPAK